MALRRLGARPSRRTITFGFAAIGFLALIIFFVEPPLSHIPEVHNSFKQETLREWGSRPLEHSVLRSSRTLRDKDETVLDHEEQRPTSASPEDELVSVEEHSGSDDREEAKESITPERTTKKEIRDVDDAVLSSLKDQKVDLSIRDTKIETNDELEVDSGDEGEPSTDPSISVEDEAKEFSESFVDTSNEEERDDVDPPPPVETEPSDKSKKSRDRKAKVNDGIQRVIVSPDIYGNEAVSDDSKENSQLVSADEFGKEFVSELLVSAQEKHAKALQKLSKANAKKNKLYSQMHADGGGHYFDEPPNDESEETQADANEDYFNRKVMESERGEQRKPKEVQLEYEYEDDEEEDEGKSVEENNNGEPDETDIAESLNSESGEEAIKVPKKKSNKRKKKKGSFKYDPEKWPTVEEWKQYVKKHRKMREYKRTWSNSDASIDESDDNFWNNINYKGRSEEEMLMRQLQMAANAWQDNQEILSLIGEDRSVAAEIQSQGNASAFVFDDLDDDSTKHLEQDADAILKELSESSEEDHVDYVWDLRKEEPKSRVIPRSQRFIRHPNNWKLIRPLLPTGMFYKESQIVFLLRLKAWMKRAQVVAKTLASNVIFGAFPLAGQIGCYAYRSAIQVEPLIYSSASIQLHECDHKGFDNLADTCTIMGKLHISCQTHHQRSRQLIFTVSEELEPGDFIVLNYFTYVPVESVFTYKEKWKIKKTDHHLCIQGVLWTDRIEGEMPSWYVNTYVEHYHRLGYTDIHVYTNQTSLMLMANQIKPRADLRIWIHETRFPRLDMGDVHMEEFGHQMFVMNDCLARSLALSAISVTIVDWDEFVHPTHEATARIRLTAPILTLPDLLRVERRIINELQRPVTLWMNSIWYEYRICGPDLEGRPPNASHKFMNHMQYSLLDSFSHRGRRKTIFLPNEEDKFYILQNIWFNVHEIEYGKKMLISAREVQAATVHIHHYRKAWHQKACSFVNDKGPNGWTRHLDCDRRLKPMTYDFL